PFYLTLTALIGTLTLLIAVAAGLGVLNTVVLGTRDRIHDLGVFKAVGMTPRQTIAMVICWIAGAGLIAGVIAVPASVILHSSIVRAMANAGGSGLPASYVNIFTPAELLLLALAGLVIGVAGALLPASWAARTRTASALRAEYTLQNRLGGTGRETTPTLLSPATGRQRPPSHRKRQLGHTARRTRSASGARTGRTDGTAPGGAPNLTSLEITMRTIRGPADIWQAETRPALNLAGRRRSALLVTLNLAAAAIYFLHLLP